MAISSDQFSELPGGVVRALKVIRRRQVIRLLACGCLAALAVFMLVMLAAMGLDWLLVFRSSLPRLVMLTTGLATAVILFYRFGLGPLRRLGRLSMTARWVEENVPALQERWSTVLELAESQDAPQVKGAPSLLRQVTEEAHALEGLVRPDRMPSLGAVRRWAMAAGLALMILVLVIGLIGQGSFVVIQRFLMPFSHASLTRVVSMTEDQILPRGEPTVLEARLEGRMVPRGELLIRSMDQEDESKITSIPLKQSLDSPWAFKFQMQSVDQSFDFRFVAGDGQSRWHHIEAVDRPKIDGIHFKVTPPAYSKLPLDERDELPRRCRALEQSEFELALHADKPVETFELVFADKRVVALETDKQGWRHYAVTLKDSFTFEPHLIDAHGLENAQPPSCRMFVYTDMPPVVKITAPKDGLSLPSDSKLTLQFEGSDDFGLDDARLKVAIQRVDGKTDNIDRPIDLGDQKGAKAFTKSLELDLAQYDLKQGDQLSVAVEMTDTRNMSGQSSMSGTPGDKKVSSPQTADASQQNAQEAGQQKDGAKDPGEPGGQITVKGDATPQTDQAKGEGCDGEGQPYPFDKEVKAKDKSAREPIDNPPPPNNNMTLRAGFGPSCTCSNSLQIKIDEWAGSFDGQEREKLQLDIDRYVARMKALLTKADSDARDLVERHRQEEMWGQIERKQSSETEKTLGECLGVVDDVYQKALGSPYAFVGHQLKDIAREHVYPARESFVTLRDFKSGEEVVDDRLSKGVYHIERALKLLEDMTREYEAAKRQQEMQERLEHVSKMHMLYIEDMMNALKSSSPSLNPRDSLGMVEVSDEMVEEIEERYEKLRELMEELTRLMAEDPELARRMAAISQLQGHTLRDQLTLLTRRQLVLVDRLERWLATPEAIRPPALERLKTEHLAGKVELVEKADSMRDNYRTWRPRKDVDPLVESLDRGSTLTEAVALTDHKALDAITRGEIDAGLDQTRQVNEKLEALALVLGSLESGQEPNENLVYFASNRMQETMQLYALETGWVVKIESLGTGDVGRAESVDQFHLMNDTMTLADKLKSLGPMINRLSTEAGDKLDELVEQLGGEVPLRQTETIKAMKNSSLSLASRNERQAFEGLQKAELCFDKLLDLVEAAVKDMPPGDSLCKVPTLEEYLKMLEREKKACEKLGIACSLANIMIKFDWFKPGDGAMGSGSGSGEGMGQGAPGSFAMSTVPSRAMQMAQQAALAQAMQATQSMDRLLNNLSNPADPAHEGPPGPEHGDPGAAPAPVPERDWNVLASHLKDELAQGREGEAPEAYRSAIEDYFRSLVDMAE